MHPQRTSRHKKNNNWLGNSWKILNSMGHPSKKRSYWYWTLLWKCYTKCSRKYNSLSDIVNFILIFKKLKQKRKKWAHSTRTFAAPMTACVVIDLFCSLQRMSRSGGACAFIHLLLFASVYVILVVKRSIALNINCRFIQNVMFRSHTNI